MGGHGQLLYSRLSGDGLTRGDARGLTFQPRAKINTAAGTKERESDAASSFTGEKGMRKTITNDWQWLLQCVALIDISMLQG